MDAPNLGVGMEAGQLSTRPIDSLWAGLNSPNIPALDGIRALAVSGVLFYHLGYENSPGSLGVLAFFVLSGFLITWLLLKEWQKHGRIDLWKFYARRGLRIFPAFYLYWVTCVVVLLVTGKAIFWPQFAAAAAYMTNYYHAVHGHHTSLVAHTWSLAVEEQFYLLWPMSFIVLLRHPDRLPSRLLWGIVLFILWRTIGRFLVELPEYHAYETLDMRCDHLLIGCWLAVVLNKKQGLAILRALTARAWFPIIPIVLLVVSDRLQAQGVQWRDSVGALIDPWLVAALIVQWVAWSRHPLWAWLNSKPIVEVGKLSYSIYLFHTLAIGVADKIFPDEPLIRIPGCCLAVLLVAWMSYRWIETPFLRWKTRFQAGGEGGPLPPPTVTMEGN